MAIQKNETQDEENAEADTEGKSIVLLYWLQTLKVRTLWCYIGFRH